MNTMNAIVKRKNNRNRQYQRSIGIQ